MKTPTKLPKGTTQAQWDEYQKKCQAHEDYIAKYRFYLARICSYLEWKKPSQTWTVDEIRSTIEREIDMASSMDAPNEPGYYRANND